MQEERGILSTEEASMAVRALPISETGTAARTEVPLAFSARGRVTSCYFHVPFFKLSFKKQDDSVALCSVLIF